jgi:hypothetical protein
MNIQFPANAKDRQRRANIAALKVRFCRDAMDRAGANIFEFQKWEHLACAWQQDAAHEAKLARYHMGLE